jgi:hypothetical protein
MVPFRWVPAAAGLVQWCQLLQVLPVAVLPMYCAAPWLWWTVWWQAWQHCVATSATASRQLLCTRLHPACRMTQNVIDITGVSGVEGALRRCSEVMLLVGCAARHHGCSVLA